MRSTSVRLTAVTRRARRKEGVAASFAGESLRQVVTIKAFGASNDVTRAFGRDARSAERAAGMATELAARIERNGEILAGVGLAGLLAFGVWLVQRGTITAGDLVVLVSYARTLGKPLRGVLEARARTSKALACATRLRQLLEIPPKIRSRYSRSGPSGIDRLPRRFGRLRERYPRPRRARLRLSGGQVDRRDRPERRRKIDDAERPPPSRRTDRRRGRVRRRPDRRVFAAFVARPTSPSCPSRCNSSEARSATISRSPTGKRTTRRFVAPSRTRAPTISSRCCPPDSTP
jgi:ABC-type multidrug transport system fused ATPase/permease subunit